MEGGDMARPKKLPTVLTEDEQERLLEQTNPRYPTGERNQTMLHLMLNTGLRLAEVIALKWRDVDLTTGKLMVRQGKGAKDPYPVGSRGRYRPPEKLEGASGNGV
jgi:site-specific recombinase XerD